MVGEIAVGEVVTGEIVLGKLRWGNDLTPNYIFLLFISCPKTGVMIKNVFQSRVKLALFLANL